MLWLGASTLLMSAASNATIITYGDVVADDTTNILTISGSSRQYSRLDALDLTLAQTEAAILPGSGHEFEGWSIANSQISDEFIESLFQGPTICTGANSHAMTTCGVLSGWQDEDLGVTGNSFEDFWAYLSTEVTPGQPVWPIGITRISNSGRVDDFDDLHPVTSYDSWRIGSSVGPVSLLLYRDVPEPTSLAIFALGLIGLTLRRFKKQI